MSVVIKLRDMCELHFACRKYVPHIASFYVQRDAFPSSCRPGVEIKVIITASYTGPGQQLCGASKAPVDPTARCVQ